MIAPAGLRDIELTPSDGSCFICCAKSTPWEGGTVMRRYAGKKRALFYGANLFKVGKKRCKELDSIVFSVMLRTLFNLIEI